MRITSQFKCIILMSVLCMTSTVQAVVTPEEAARLTTDLTPFGAERAGNDAGTIPEWTGGLKIIPAGLPGGRPSLCGSFS